MQALLSRFGMPVVDSDFPFHSAPSSHLIHEAVKSTRLGLLKTGSILGIKWLWPGYIDTRRLLSGYRYMNSLGNSQGAVGIWVKPVRKQLPAVYQVSIPFD